MLLLLKTFPFSSRIKSSILSSLASLGYRLVAIESHEQELQGRSPAFSAQSFFVNLINPEKLVIFDVGANIGQAYRIYRHLYPQARIYCFEPFPESCEVLSQLVDADPLSSVHQLALSFGQGHANLNSNPSSATNSLLPTAVESSRFWGEGLLETSKVIQVDKTTLEAFMDSVSESRISILKLDVQGAEYDVLLGSSRLLRDQLIDVIYLELIICPTYENQRPLHDYFQYLHDHGYRFVDFYNPIRSGKFLNQVDAIFVSPKVYHMSFPE